MAECSSVVNASEEVFDFVCGPCSVDGEVLQAKGYCSNCQDYLCDLCFKIHIRPKPWRHHVLLDEKAMPKQTKATTTKKTSDICTEICDKHPGNIIEYYCQTHGFLGCTKCFISDNHRKCEDVVCIEDTANAIFHSQEFTNFESSVEQLANVLSESSSIQLQNDENIKIYSIRAKNDIKNFRARINEYHDRQKNQMDNQVSQMKDRQMSQLVSTSKQIANLEKDMKSIQETIERTRNLGQKSNLYIYMKRNSDQLKLLEDRIEIVKKDSVVSEYTFTPDENLLGQEAKTFGTLVIKESAKHVEGYQDNQQRGRRGGGYSSEKRDRSQPGDRGNSDQHSQRDKKADYTRSYSSSSPTKTLYKRRDDESTAFLSETLSSLLRHDAERFGFTLMEGGFLFVGEILLQTQKLRGFTVQDVVNVVEDNDKEQFALKKDEKGYLMIRANHGHSIEEDALDLTPITSANDVPAVVHGTSYESWDIIKTTGLKRMNRNHILFFAGEPAQNEEINGMRSTCQVSIYIDLEKALSSGLKFFRSANNVIMSPGDRDGYIYPCFFMGARDRYNNYQLIFDSTIKTAPIIKITQEKHQTESHKHPDNLSKHQLKKLKKKEVRLKKFAAKS